MENRVDSALAFHKKGYNCAQAVLCAYCDLFGMDTRTAFCVAEGFGGGIGGMHDGTCGAACALYMLEGLKQSSGAIENGVTKKATYAGVQELSKAFQEKNGSSICRELLSMKDERYKGTCDDRIASAARIVEAYLVSE